ncbi:extracellular solute-binding protein [Paenibacillus sepulcri]|uniref:Extracellular solute-binding protein n=1 Tax=Paenibacillus sepulcri TaxID=359917 RepID=A0ABS7C494_9BACL|nr:extracellular solute-binding protein [Paenibacillus sepulcri]
MPRNRFMRSICLFMLAVTMMIAGCSSGNGNAPAEGNQPAGKKGPTKISMMVIYYAAEPPKPDAAVFKKLQELTNTELDITWIPSSAYSEKLNVSVTSGDMPMAMFVSQPMNATIVSSARSGMFWEIGPLLKDYPLLSKIDPLAYHNLKIDGKDYGLPRPQPIGVDTVIYRKDWMKNLGLSEPKTIEDVYQMAKAFQTGDPDGNGKDDTIGFATDTSLAGLNIVLAWYGAPNKFNRDESGKFTTDFMTPEYVEALKFFKRMYDDKVMNTDFVLTQTAQKVDLIRKGIAGMYFEANFNSAERQLDIRTHTPEAEIDIAYRIQGPKGERLLAALGYNARYMFSKTSVKTEAQLRDILAFFEKMQTPEVVTLLKWGIEGVHYKVENGKNVSIDEVLYNKEVEPLKFLRLDSENADLTGNSPLDTKVNETYADMASISVQDPAIALISQTMTEKGAQLTKIIDDAKIKFILGELDEAGFKQEVDKWLKSGGQNILDEYAAEYAKENK